MSKRIKKKKAKKALKLKQREQKEKLDKAIFRKENFSMRDGKLCKKRTEEEYKELFEYFKENIASEYCENLGYTLEDIEKIGYKKFLDTVDYSSKEEMDNWKNDVGHAIVCPHCKDDFSIFEIQFGLCNSCVKHYDFRKIVEFMHSTNSTLEQAELYIEFVYNDDLREKFIK